MTSAAVSVPDLPAQSGLKESPKNFFLDADGNAWLVTLSDKLYMYDFQSEAIGVSAHRAQTIAFERKFAFLASITI